MNNVPKIYPGVAIKKGLSFTIAIITFLTLYGYSSAIEVSTVLNNAKKEGKAVMLELGSVGCIPCEQMKPVMERLRTSYKGKLEVIFVDVRKDRDTAQKFKVFVIPTQVFLDKNGKEIHRHVGYYAYEEIAPVLRKIGL